MSMTVSVSVPATVSPQGVGVQHRTVGGLHQAGRHDVESAAADTNSSADSSVIVTPLPA